MRNLYLSLLLSLLMFNPLIARTQTLPEQQIIEASCEEQSTGNYGVRLTLSSFAYEDLFKSSTPELESQVIDYASKMIQSTPCQGMTITLANLKSSRNLFVKRTILWSSTKIESLLKNQDVSLEFLATDYEQYIRWGITIDPVTLYLAVQANRSLDQATKKIIINALLDEREQSDRAKILKLVLMDDQYTPEQFIDQALDTLNTIGVTENDAIEYTKLIHHISDAPLRKHVVRAYFNFLLNKSSLIRSWRQSARTIVESAQPQSAIARTTFASSERSPMPSFGSSAYCDGPTPPRTNGWRPYPVPAPTAPYFDPFRTPARRDFDSIARREEFTALSANICYNDCDLVCTGPAGNEVCKNQCKKICISVGVEN